MALQLLLFRHAKSAWDDPGLEDFDRPLNQRGRSAAPVMGELIAAEGLTPQLVLCSTAQRARETLALASPWWSPAPRIEELDEIYRLMSSDYVGVIRQTGAGASRLMVVGHNPAMERTAGVLVGAGGKDARRLLAEGFPTAAVAVIAFEEENWSGVGPGRGTLTAFLTPRGSA